MTQNGWGLFRLGMKRRTREVRRLRFMLCLSVFFFAFVLLFQDNMNSYTMESNYRSYGRWLIQSESSAFADNPYLELDGTIRSGSRMYLTKDRNASASGAQNTVALQKQLEINADDTSRETNVFVGTLDPAFAERNSIRLYEGRFPYTDGEAVMELTALQALGLGYELGQELSFYVSEPVEWIETEPEAPGALPETKAVRRLQLVTFTLVGTVERYSARWSGEGDLPGVILSESAYEALNTDDRLHRFYTLRAEYRTGDVWSFALELLEGIAASGSYDEYVYQVNDAAYYNPFWGDPTMYRVVTVVLILLSSAILSYLMATYLGKRRRFFLRLRELGASTREVWRMASYECVGSAIPSMLAALACAYALSLFAVLLVSRVTGIRFFYVFFLKTTALIVLCAALTLAISLASALLMLSGRALTEKRKSLPVRAARRLLRRGVRKAKRGGPYLGAPELLRRLRMTTPLRTAFLRAAGVLCCAVFLVCVMRVLASVETYRNAADTLGDLQGWIGTEFNQRLVIPVERYRDARGRWKDTVTEKLSAKAQMLRRTIPEAFFQQAGELPGVEHIGVSMQTFGWTLDWDGKSSDPFFQAYLTQYAQQTAEMLTYGAHSADLSSDKAQRYLDRLEQSLTLILCEKDAEAVWSRYQGQIDRSVGDYDAFVRGEHVIVVVDQHFTLVDYARSYSGAEVDRRNYWEELGASFAPGDRLELLFGSSRIPTLAAAVVDGGSELGSSGLQIIGSEALLRKLADAEGVTAGYNRFRVDLNALSDRENTVKTLAGLCAEYGVEYTSYAETLRTFQDEIVQNSVTYGFFGLALLVLYLFVLSAVSVERSALLERSMRALRSLGASAAELRSAKRSDALRQSLYLLLSFPLFFAAYTVIVWGQLADGGFVGYFSRLLHRFLFHTGSGSGTGTNIELSPWLIAAVYTLEQWRPWRMLLPLGIVAVIVWIITGRTGKGEDKHGSFRLHP